MPPEPLEVFKTSVPAIRAAWIDLLKDEPSLSALGRPDTVGFLMDASFIQVTVGLRASGTAIPWLAGLLPVAGPVHNHLACGMVGIRKYYSTGQQAILRVIEQIPEARVDEVISIFNNIA